MTTLPRRAAASAPPLLRARSLRGLPWLGHGFSTRRSGRRGQDFDLRVSARNQHRFTRAVLGPRADLLTLKQVHSALIWRDPEPQQSGDAMMTDAPGRLLAIKTADCVPILLVDVRRRAVSAVHAGWRGTLARIAEKTVGEMRAAFGTEPTSLRAVIGPSIRGCCYEVGEEVHHAFCAQFAYGEGLFLDAEDDPVRNRYPMLFMTGAPPGHPYDPRWNPTQPHRLDLAAANLRQLVDAGIAQAAVEILPFCTACHPERFFSHRHGAAGRMLSGIGIL